MSDDIPQHLLGGQNVAILAMDGVERAELAGPRDALLEMGINAPIISARRGQIAAVEGGRPAGSFDVQLTLDKADPYAFDGVLIPGGERNVATLRGVAEAQAFVRAMDELGKPLAAICHGPWLLVSAGLVSGRRMTGVPALADEVRRAGGQWQDEAAVIDGHWVSSRAPEDIPAFVDGFKQILAERMKRSVAGTGDDTITAVGVDG